MKESPGALSSLRICDFTGQLAGAGATRRCSPHWKPVPRSRPGAHDRQCDHRAAVSNSATGDSSQAWSGASPSASRRTRSTGSARSVGSSTGAAAAASPRTRRCSRICNRRRGRTGRGQARLPVGRQRIWSGRPRMVAAQCHRPGRAVSPRQRRGAGVGGALDDTGFLPSGGNTMSFVKHQGRKLSPAANVVTALRRAEGTTSKNNLTLSSKTGSNSSTEVGLVERYS